MSLALLLAGCVVSRPEYPATWAPLAAPQSTCASIAGTYADDGEPYGREHWAPPLIGLLFPKEKAQPRARQVAITQPEVGVVEITPWYNTDAPAAARRLSESAGDYRCRGGGIEIERRERVGGGQAVGVETTTLHLSKSTDGALVVKQTLFGFGLCLIVPCGASEIKWIRFAERGSP